MKDTKKYSKRVMGSLLVGILAITGIWGLVYHRK